MAPDDELRAVTDEVGDETFTFHAGPLTWKTFAAELAEYADLHGLGFESTRRSAGLWGLLGTEITCVVTGRFSEITEFAEFARSRLRLYRDGNVAG